MKFSIQRHLAAALVLFFCPTASTHPKTAAREVCTRKTECHLCTGTDVESIPECKATGKMESFSCELTENDATTVRTRHKIESCQRTRPDEDYLMIQLQVICLLLGSFSYATVKRQRAQYASGFDQRKANTSQYSTANIPQYSSRTGNGGGGGSLQRDSTAEERAPLADSGETDSGGIEVV